MINILNKIYLGKKLFILLILTFHSLSLREDGRNSGQEPGCKDHEGNVACGLAPQGSLSVFLYTLQDQQSGKCPTDMPTVQSDRDNFSIEVFSSQLKLLCVQFDKTISFKPRDSILKFFLPMVVRCHVGAGIEPDSYKRS